MSNVWGSNLGTNYDLIPRMFADPLPVLREENKLLATTRKDFANAAGKIGDNVVVPITGDMSTSTVTPAMIPPQPGDMNVFTKTVQITEWIKADPFYLTAKDVSFYELNGIVPAQIKQAYRALAKAVNQKLFSFYYRIYGLSGVAGTGAFASTSNVLSTTMRVLQDQLCPDSPDIPLFLGLKDVEALKVLDTYMKYPQLAQRPGPILSVAMHSVSSHSVQRP